MPYRRDALAPGCVYHIYNRGVNRMPIFANPGNYLPAAQGEKPVNKQQERTGPLFQGRFRHIHVDRDEYVMHLCRYVHLNPVVAGLVSRPEAWPYSNYLEWIKAREGKLVDRAFVQEFFPTPESYIAFVQGHVALEKAKELQPYLLDDGD